MITILAETLTYGEEIKPFVEKEINGMGWFMLLFGVVVLYGGVALCLFRAMGAKVHPYTEADEVFKEEEPITKSEE